jgi:hypothetical protein
MAFLLGILLPSLYLISMILAHSKLINPKHIINEQIENERATNVMQLPATAGQAPFRYPGQVDVPPQDEIPTGQREYAPAGTDVIWSVDQRRQNANSLN